MYCSIHSFLWSKEKHANISSEHLQYKCPRTGPWLRDVCQSQCMTRPSRETRPAPNGCCEQLRGTVVPLGLILVMSTLDSYTPHMKRMFNSNNGGKGERGGASDETVRKSDHSNRGGFSGLCSPPLLVGKSKPYQIFRRARRAGLDGSWPLCLHGHDGGH